MTFGDIPAGCSLFIDANTFVYHFTPHPVLQQPCQELLERIGRQEISGFTSADVLRDMAHRLMTLEAVQRFGWPYAGIAQRLRRHPAEVRQLSLFRQAVDDVPQLGIQIRAVTAPMVSAAAAISQQTGLLSGDALLVAVMQEHGLTHLASHDADFDSVSGLSRYAPA